MGTFGNTTLGGGEVEVDDVALGYTEGDIEFSRTAETKDLEDGIPLQTVGRVIFREQVNVKVNALEITAANLSSASLNIPVTTIAGTPATVSFGGTPPESQARTFAAYQSGGIQAIHLAGPSVTSLVVKNAAEDVTYVVNDDYILDAVRGIVYRNPGGDITAGETVHVAYGYTPPASERLNLGRNLPIQDKKIKITHISPVSGKIVTILIHKSNGQGTLGLNLQKEEYWSCQLDMLAVPSSDHPDNPLGYIDIQEAP